MGKQPSFQFYPGDARRDAELHMMSFQSRGVWWEMICCMWDAKERGKLFGTSEQLCRLLGCTPPELQTAIHELSVTKTADVTVCDDFITVINRRMFKAAKERQQARDRMERYRERKKSKRKGDDDITPPSSSSSSSSCNSNTVTKNISASGDAVDGEKFFLTKKKRKLSGKRLETFNRFWDAFNHKHGKAEAADAWLDIPTLTEATVAAIIDAAKKEAERRKNVIAQGKTPKWAQGWLSGRRWEDEEYSKPPEKDTRWEGL